MKKLREMWFPDHDEHFPAMMARAPLYRGKGTYQIKKLNAAMPLVKEKKVAVDVGGHVGLWSWVLSHQFEQVIAFEPMPEHVECFKANCGERKNITLHQCALADRRGWLEFDMPDDNTGHTHVMEGTGKGCYSRTLDEFVLERVDFLKIDVEGFEMAVLEGALETILRCRPVVVVEQKPNNAEAQGYRQHEARDALVGLGMTEKWVLSGDHCLVWE